MSDEMFAELLQSMKEAVAITNGKAPAARRFSYPEAKDEIKAADKSEYPYKANTPQRSYAMM